MNHPLRPLVVLTLVVLHGAVACGGDSGPPPKVAREDAGTQLRRVATRWGDTFEDDGALVNDPNGVQTFHVVTARTLTLGDVGRASLRIERTESFQTKLGPFRCKAKGTLAGTATYAWQAGEAQVRIELPAADLPRACEQPGFPVPAKVLGAETTMLVLRGDRLIGRTAARDRTLLFPLQ